MLIQIKCFIIIWHFWGGKKAHIFFVQTSTLILKDLIPAKGASKTKGAIICFSFLPLPQNFDNEQFSIFKKKDINLHKDAYHDTRHSAKVQIIF